MQPLITVSVCFLITLTFPRISSYKETGIELYVQGNPYVEIYRHSSINKTCRNIKEYNINLIVGIKVVRNCAELYDELNCNGNSIKISWFSPFQDNLTQWNFNKKTKSIRACPDPCDSDVQSSVALNSVNKVIEIEIELYEKQKKKERTFVVKVQGCTHFNESLKEKFPIASIKVPKNQCVLGFFVDLVDPEERPTWTDADCAVKPYKFNVVEFRDGTPMLVNIGRWIWTFLRDPQFFVAFSPCHYCNDLEGITATSTTIKASTTTEILTSKTSKLIASTTSPLNHIMEVRTKTEGMDDPQERINNHSSSKIWLTIVCILACISIVLTLLLIRFRNRAKTLIKTASETLSEKEVDEFMKGLGLELGSASEVNNHGNSIVNEKEPELEKLSADLLAQNQPYNEKLEVSLDKLRFDMRCLIGSGEFGNVFKGTMLGTSGASFAVAIKTAKSQSHAQYLRALLKEVKVMMYVGKHPKIVGLIGCCTVNLRRGV